MEVSVFQFYNARIIGIVFQGGKNYGDHQPGEMQWVQAVFNVLS